MRAVTAALMILLAAAAPAAAQESYEIMRPEKSAPKYEPWLAPKYKSPRGTTKHVVIPMPAEPAQPPAPKVPPPIVVPQTGRVLPNLPAPAGSGPGGRETSQDRAMRCAHQAGVYGTATGDRGSYLGACINQ